MSAKQVVYARAISVLSSKTMITNVIAFAIAASSLTEVTTVIPPRFLPMLGMLVALGNLYLRSVTVRPVAMIARGDVKVVAIPKIDPPAPPAVTD